MRALSHRRATRRLASRVAAISRMESAARAVWQLGPSQTHSRGAGPRNRNPRLVQRFKPQREGAKLARAQRLEWGEGGAFSPFRIVKVQRLNLADLAAPPQGPPATTSQRQSSGTGRSEIGASRRWQSG